VTRSIRDRLLAVTGLIAAVISMSAACTAQTPTRPTPSASAAAPLTFDDGQRLDPAQKVVWADPFASSKGYTVHTKDHGDGSWSYKSDATGCIIGYYEGAPKNMDAAAGDSALSDGLLAAQFGSSAAEIAEYAEDGVAPFRTPSQPVETRAVVGTDAEAGTTYIVAARAFAALGTGFVASLECPAKLEVRTEWKKLNSGTGAFALVFTPTQG
jgi:hypothetical protein